MSQGDLFNLFTMLILINLFLNGVDVFFQIYTKFQLYLYTLNFRTIDVNNFKSWEIFTLYH